MFTTLTSIWTLVKAAKDIYKIIAVIVAIAGLYFGGAMLWENTKQKIAAPYVAAERLKVEEEARLKWEPEYVSLSNQFQSLTTQYNALKENIVETRKAQAIEGQKALDKEKERANRNEIKYRESLKKYEIAIAERDSRDVSIKQLDDRLRIISTELATSNSDSSETRRVSRYADELGKRYESCERALTEANNDADAANDRASKCSAAVRALSGN